MYLPGQALTCGRIYFLASNPDTTIMNPANANRVLTIAGYNAVENAILLESGRGYTIDRRIKPDLAAPGYAVEGAVAGRGNFRRKPGMKGRPVPAGLWRSHQGPRHFICNGATDGRILWSIRHKLKFFFRSGGKGDPR